MTVGLAEATDRVAAVDPALARVIRRAGPIHHRKRDPDGPFAALVRAITFQQLSGRSATAIHGRLRALVDGAFTPEALVDLSDEQLLGAGLSHNKMAALRDLAAKVLDGTVVLRAGARMPDAEIIERLVSVRGIGPWTAEMFLIFELHRLDVWPVDDLGVRQGFTHIWPRDDVPTPKQLEPEGERFRPYRTVLARYCWAAAALEPGGTSVDLR
ncbi:DNA-3-methyladenine glycosylase [Asanoa ishikariensis]|uniref:DNA-3-methyladenine glycosylase II n=1 Tax=Asanoa ishikariensis TaxID=137265 RepID=A0A1H3QWE6_9ACTN|nr:DNA-3-methyladenine glycosylase [Asanoa ishikariensis]GIF64627.1 DNA-3-methyladenine glycosylase [Asanoa ishikariensis]SDZ17864.1 DNA-3-methyladenine glycosylase II [Asanoa ishikariensis]